MENRFTFKDLIFLVMIILVLSATLFSIYQFKFNETALLDVKGQIQKLGDEQKQQTVLLGGIRDALRQGVQINNPGLGTQPAASGQIHRVNPDGSLYVYYPEIPKSPRDHQAAPDYAVGDWLVLNLSSEPRLIAPFIEKDEVAQEVHNAVLEPLVNRNPETFAWEPWLAESFERSGDGKTIRFTLRKNITFSDGSPVTVEDVIFSFNTLMNPGIDAAPLRSYYSHVTSCQKIDDRTVEFKLDEPYFLSLDYIGNGLLIIPEHVYKFAKPEDYNNRPDLLVGTGPYKVDKWTRGQQIELTRNDHYWADRPTFDRVIFKFIVNPQAAFQSFQNGQIDYFDPDPDQYRKFSQDPEFQKNFTAHLYQRPGSGYAFIGYNEEKPMFKDKVTRQALSMLIDRKAMMHTLMYDIATETTGHFSPMSPQNDPSIKPWPYDPERARKQLAEAGWKPGNDGVLARNGVRFEFDLSFGAGNPLTERIGSYVKEQLASAGILVHLTPWEFAVFVERLDNRQVDAGMMSWVNGGAEVEDDPYQIWHSEAIKNKGSNFIAFRNKESDALIEEARKTMDDEKRQAIWHKWQALIHEEAPYTFLYARMERMFANGRFRNTKPYKLILTEYDWYVPAGLQKYH